MVSLPVLIHYVLVGTKSHHEFTSGVEKLLNRLLSEKDDEEVKSKDQGGNDQSVSSGS